MRTRNQRIAGSAALNRFDREAPIPFLCECSDDRCSELLRLSLDRYDAARNGGDFFVAPGHQVDGAEIVRVRDACWLYRAGDA